MYVYMNSVEGLLNSTYSLRLTGKPESRFGFSMTTLGDINKDGFNDLAVGAPYTDDGGTVYVYLGSKDGIRKDPVQIISATDLLMMLGSDPHSDTVSLVEWTWIRMTILISLLVLMNPMLWLS